MTAKQAAKLKVGDQVVYRDLQNEDPTEHEVFGQVTDVGYCAMTIRWSDGLNANLKFSDTYMMPQIERDA